MLFRSDLTVFNGEAPRGDDPNDSGNRVAFQSRYKDGGSRSKAGTKAGLANAGQPNNTDGAMKNRGYSYHTSSTAQLRTTPYQTLVQPNPPVGGPQGTRYSAYFMAQLGYATQQPQDQAASQPMHNSATTLGYLNTGYRLTNIVGQSTDTADDFDGFGPPQLVPTQTQYNGTARDMTAPVWLNRTFANANELMMVPWTSPGQFGYYYGIAADDTARTPFE